MPGFTRTPIEHVPNAALTAIARASERTGVSQNDIINWCLNCLGYAYPRSRFYWVQNHANRAGIVPMDPIIGGGFRRVILNLTPVARSALGANRIRFSCDDGIVIAVAAQLAAYYRRTDGRLGYGFVMRSRVMKLEMLQMIG